jgi:hypothetical protein
MAAIPQKRVVRNKKSMSFMVRLPYRMIKNPKCLEHSAWRNERKDMIGKGEGVGGG